MPQATPFTTSRTLQAPRALVWRVFTEPAHLAKWLSPQGFDTFHAAMDFRPGGRYHYGLEGPGGMKMWGLQQFRDIVPEEKIVHLQSFSDEQGGLARHPMAPTWPLQMLATTTFADAGEGKTVVTLAWGAYEADDIGNATFEAGRPGMHAGWGGTFVKLDSYLAELQK